MERGDDASLTPQDRLLDALLNHRLEEFTELLQDSSVKADYRYGKPHFASCLEIACRRVDKGAFVEVLLQTARVRPYVNTIIPEPIHYAAKVGAYDALKLLMQHKKVDVNVVDSRGDTALHYLAGNYHKSEDNRYRRCMELLIARHDVDINKPNKKGYTAIHQAAYYGCKDMINLILKYRRDEVDLDTYVASGRTARTFLAQKYPDLCQKLPEIKYSAVRGYESQILVAFQNRHLEVFCGLLRQVDKEGNPLFDPDFCYGKPYSGTCLEMACRQLGYQEYLEVLLNAGADPNRVGKSTYKAPIHIAAEALNLDALTMLLDTERINVNAMDKQGWTALHYLVAASSSQHPELSDKESQSSDPSIADTDKSPAELINAKAKERDDNLEKCIHRLHEKMTIYVDMNELMELARSKGNLKAFEILASLEFKECYEDDDDAQKLNSVEEEYYSLGILRSVPMSHSPLRDRLFDYVHKQMTEVFINSFTEAVDTDGDLVHCRDSSGNTLLQVAVQGELFDVVEVLLKHGADPNASYNRRPPLVTAARQQNLTLLQLLLGQKSILVDAADMKGDTALHHVVRAENLECAVALLNCGADIRKQNVLGKTPLSLKGLKSLLDKSLMTNTHYFPHHEDYEVIFDYTLITANKSECCNLHKPGRKVSYNRSNGVVIDLGEQTGQDENLLKRDVYSELKSETKLLHYISDNYKTYRSLLDHPVISSFLQFKWDCVKLFFYINLAYFFLFFLVLNVFIMVDPRSVCESNSTSNATINDTRPSQSPEVFEIMRYTLLVFTIPLSFRELVQFLILHLRYLKGKENYLDLAILISTWTLIAADIPGCWRARLDVVAILLSCMELILLIGRHPKLSLNIEMLKAVSLSYLGFLVSYVFLILAFSHCMYIVFRDSMTKDNVPNLLWAICRTIVFMTGEYDAKDLSFGSLPYTTIIVFLLFVFFISIVLLNLLIGLSVNDTRTIQDKSKVLAITCRIHVVYEIETVVLEWYKTYRKWFPRLAFLDKCFRFVILFHNSPHQKRLTTLPNKEGSIKDHPFGRGVKVDNFVLEEAVRMISTCQQTAIAQDNADKKIDSWEKSVLEMLSALKENCALGKRDSTFVPDD